jgi:ABC-type antimicrobial peptide transport system permease subunit
LTGIGLFGTMSYSVARRTQEIGIRMALGAGRQQVMRMVLSEALVTVVTGGLVGVAAAVFAARTIASLLFGLQPQDPTTILLAAGLLVATSLVAAFVPALRACRTAPIDALRNE